MNSYVPFLVGYSAKKKLKLSKERPKLSGGHLPFKEAWINGSEQCR